MNAIADTGFLVALLEAHDKHHRWAMEIAEGIKWHECPVQSSAWAGFLFADRRVRLPTEEPACAVLCYNTAYE
jgi:predicted nucleic acid-binding protein